jgi:predicted nucleotidyltransferase
MRLSEYEIQSIKKAAEEIFGPNVQVYLFGSRTDDKKKCGDIDLYIKSESKNAFTQKIKFLVSLEKKIGEQKIDVVLATDETRPIEQQAISSGVLL